MWGAYQAFNPFPSSCCGVEQHCVKCLHCEMTFTRSDALKRHLKKAHPKPVVTNGLCCQECKKSFQYELALHLHEERCGKEKAKPFKCTFAGCGKSFHRKSTLEHHQQHFHLSQLGSGVKRTLDQETREVKRARQDFPKKIDEKGIREPDREDSMLEGNRVNAYCYSKTKAQKVDQKVFFKESMPRLEEKHVWRTP